MDLKTVPDSVLARLREFDQEHLLRFWGELKAPERARLLDEIESVDFALLDELRGKQSTEVDWGALAARATSPPAVRLRDADRSQSAVAVRSRGEEALSQGKIGALLVAGGQGTRLGFPHPKGMFPIGPVSGAPLFQIHFEKLLAIGERYGRPIPLWLMTSPATDRETREFLAEKKFFGLDPDQVRVFCQGTMPAVDAATGRILLADRRQLALSPDGHGGMLSAFRSSGGLAEVEERGIETLFYFQVDNPLTQVCDPEYIGHHLLARSEVSTQVVAKRNPDERVGNVVGVDGRVRVIEYSDMPAGAGGRRDAAGELILWAGSIAVHLFDVAFLARMAQRADALPFHRALKKAAFVDASGAVVEPATPNAVKFERFIFDLLEHADRSLVVEVDPAQAFAPVKNAPGAVSDSPEQSQAALLALAAGWLRTAGASVSPGVPVEISPLFAMSAEDCQKKIGPGATFLSATYLR